MTVWSRIVRWLLQGHEEITRLEALRQLLAKDEEIPA